MGLRAASRDGIDDSAPLARTTDEAQAVGSAGRDRQRRTALAVIVAAALITPVGCGTSTAPPLAHLAATEDYLPGVAVDVFLPESVTRAPVVVLIPGGGWQTADRGGLRPLADALAGAGIAAFTATYRIGTDSARFPVPVADVVCAVDFAVDRTRRTGRTLGPVTVLGHSSGAQLAALAALAPRHFRRDCPHPPARIDGFIGLAGAYDPIALRDLATALFGVPPDADPGVWRAGTPATWASANPRLPVLLAHGTADTTLPPSFSVGFAHQLRVSGHPVELRLVPGADHASIYRPEVVSKLIADWLYRRDHAGIGD